MKVSHYAIASAATLLNLSGATAIELTNDTFSQEVGGSVRGQIKYKGGDPVRKSVVVAIFRGTSTTSTGSSCSNTDGTFLIKALPPGEYQICALDYSCGYIGYLYPSDQCVQVKTKPASATIASPIVIERTKTTKAQVRK